MNIPFTQPRTGAHRHAGKTAYWRLLAFCFALLCSFNHASAQNLYTEGADLNNTSATSTFNITAAGTYTVVGTLATTADGQDWFNINVGAGFQLNSVSYNISGGSFNGGVNFGGMGSYGGGPGSGSISITPFTFPLSAGTYFTQMFANFSTGSSWTMTYVVTAAPGGTPPAITANPSNSTICSGNNTTFSVTATNATGYQWEVNTGSGWSNVSNGAPYSGATTATLTITGATTAMSGYQYRCTASGAVTPDATSTAATLTVNATPTVNAISNQTLCNGASTTAVIFSGTATTYSWTNNTTSVGLGASGTGNIASFTATNTGTTASVATITVTPSTATCTGSTRNFTITVNPTPTVNTITDQTVCAGTSTAAVNFSGAVTGTTYNWTNTNTAIGLGASGSGNIAAFTATNAGTTAISGTVTVTPVANTCTGSTKNFTVTVNPTPTVNSIGNQTLCNGASTAAVNFSGAVAGTTYNWTNNAPSIGLAASGSGNIASFTATNTGAATVTGTVTVTPVANTCNGTTQNFTITVNPTPTVNTISNQTVCNGATTAAVNFSGAVTGTTYNWTNTNTAIGLGASGTGNIAAFTATNAGTTAISGTITVTPVAATCTGTTKNFTVTVNPTPTVNGISNQTLCNGATTTAVNFSGAVAGTTYNWTNTAPSIGLAASGSGNIAAFTATNTGTTAVTATITVTPSASTCNGSTQNFTITVNPTPTVNSIGNQTVCNGATTTAVNFSGAVTGTTYNWTNTNTAIGLGASGTGNIAAFTATNTGAAAIAGTVTVTPVANTCTGSTQNFTITVNPTPTVNTIANQTLCNGATTTAVSFSGAVTGTTYNWSNTNTAIGLGASGTGNIAAFPATNTGSTIISGTVTVTPVAATCTGVAKTFTITVNPTPTVNTISNQTVCNGATTAAVNFSGAVTGTSYNWTNTNTAIGLGASGTGNIAAFTATNTGATAISGTVTVTPVAATCTGTTKNFTITVNPTPTVNTVPDQTVCNGATTAAVNFSGAVTGTTYSWTNSNTTIGLGASGTGNIAPFTATNTGTSAISGTITVTPSANSCTGSTRNLSIIVNPTPTINSIANQTLCNGATTATVNFSGAVTGTTYSWTNNTPSIGLAASGTGNIAAFTALNAGTAPITATIVVTPGASTCTGVTQSFTITVNPTPKVNFIGNQQICNGTNTGAVIFSGPVSGTTYAWTNNNTSIGLAASGSGTGIPAFTATNASTTQVVATITVTPTANSCVGTNSTYTYTVKPTPSVNTIPNQALCNGMTTTAVVFAGPVSSTVFYWTNNNTTIGLGANGVGAVSAFTATNTGSNNNVGTITVTPTANSCTGATRIFTITVYPTPKLSSSLTPPAICDSTIFNYTPLSATSSTSFAWNRPAIVGISNPTSAGLGNPAEYLDNNTPAPISVVYTYTLTANGCSNAQDVTVTVNPKPELSSSLVPPAICNNTQFSYTPTSLVTGTTFAWSRPTVSAISNPAASGTNDPLETLNNVTANPAVATYIYTLAANGCSNQQNVTVTVNPTPTLSNALTASICSGDSFNFVPASATSGTVFMWSRPAVADISPSTGNGVGPIHEKLVNSSTQNINVTYVFTLTANGCVNTQNVILTVKPTPVIPIIAIKPPADLCSNTMYQNFGAATPPPAGTTYTWTATNATIWTQSSDKQNILVNFPTAGTSTITLTTTISTSGCLGKSSYTVTTGTNVSDVPDVIYYNKRFICLKNDRDSYQWGYDDHNTLDSAIIVNETGQDYLNDNPDLANKYYWVMTTKGGCMQKSYYNKPTGIANTIAADRLLKVYPNPASDYLTVETDNVSGKTLQLNVFDIAGRMLKNVQTTTAKTQISIADMPSGVYMLNVFENGVKVGVSRFVKN